jgi:hypothetical protein
MLADRIACGGESRGVCRIVTGIRAAMHVDHRGACRLATRRGFAELRRRQRQMWRLFAREFGADGGNGDDERLHLVWILGA